LALSLIVDQQKDVKKAIKFVEEHKDDMLWRDLIERSLKNPEFLAEMLEHVGSKYYHKYFQLVDFALKSRNATAVVSASTFPESRYSTYQPEDFMRRYMWPNSCLPSATALIEAANTGSQCRFTLEGVENHAAHYPRTLREWGRRLEENVRQDMLVKDYPALKDIHEYEAFKRKWQYLFAYAGAGFAKGYITCHMLTFTRPSDCPIACD